MRMECALLIGSLLAAAVPGASAGDVQPGLWRLSLSSTMAGTGQSVGPFERTQCFTAADTRDPEKLFVEAGAECAYSNRRYEGNRFSFTIQCGGALPMTGSGSVEYDTTAFAGELNLKARVPDAGEIETVNRVTGNRLGGC